MVTAGLPRAPGGANTRNFHLLKALSNTYRASLLVFANDAEINAVLFFTKKCWPIMQEQVPDTTWQIVRKNPPAGVKKMNDEQEKLATEIIAMRLELVNTRQSKFEELTALLQRKTATILLQ